MPFNLDNLYVELRIPETDCGNLPFQMFLAEIHSLDETTFEKAVRAFTNPELAPKEYKSDEIYGMIDVDCANFIIEIGYDPAIKSNTDIDFRVVASAAVVNYSISLFKGLQLLFPSAVYQFFKAEREIKGAKFYDVIFRIVTTDATGLKSVVYLGDYSDLRP